MSTLDALLLVALLFLALSILIFFLTGRKIRKDIDKYLDEATTEEQEVIQKQLVKALFPPRFHR